MRLLLENIKELVQVENRPVPFASGKKMASVKTVKNAFLLIHDCMIEAFGPMEGLANIPDDDDLLTEIDCTGRMVFPCYCDPHTHIVFPGARVSEFADKIRGLSYAEIARRGGGILNSAKRLHEMPEEELYVQAMKRVSEMISLGTGAIEIKSGYGLNTADELKMLRVIKNIKEASPATVKATFLGAHAVPEEFAGKRSSYVDLIINEMIPEIAALDLADFIDVFCDEGFFSVEDTERILMAGIKYGLRAKIHANELAFSGGVQAGVKYNALSVDHLEHAGGEEIEYLKGTEIMPTVLPGSAFFLGLPLAPVRQMIDAGLPVALASDFNPGSSPSGNMNFIGSLGCLRYKMLPEEVINATTLNAAYAMGVSSLLGSIAKGKKANIFITKEIEEYACLPYYFGSNLIDTVILNGEIQHE